MGTNTGWYSKFQERLKNIVRSRSKKNRYQDDSLQDKVDNIKEKLKKDSSRNIIVSDNDKNLERGSVVRHVRVGVSEKEVRVKEVVEASEIVKEKRISNPKKSIIVGKEKDIDKVTSSPKDNNKVVTVGLIKKRVVGLGEDDKKVDLEANKIVGSKQQSNAPSQAKVNKDNIRDDSTNKKVIVLKKNFGYHDSHADIRDNIQNLTEEEKDKLIDDLSSSIIQKIKGSFEDNLDELEVLMSELYFMKEEQDVALEMKQVKEIKKKIDELIDKINKLIDEYNLYKKNYYIDNVILVDDNVLVDDIIDYRMLVDSLDAEKEFVKEYKLLEEFKSLYSNLSAVREDTVKLVKDNEHKIEEFDIRDKKYDEIKLGVVKVEQIQKDCLEEIDSQNEYFANLMKKIEDINTEEYVTYHLRGIGDLLGQSLRYIGLMMMSPFGGLIPGIAVNTLMTRRLINNIYRNMRIEEVNHVRYNAIDYDREINGKITDVDYTSALISDTLTDIEKLKEDFMLQYNSKIPGYDETLMKIEKAHALILRNQNRLEIVKKNLLRSKKINANKLVRVKNLNEG